MSTPQVRSLGEIKASLGDASFDGDLKSCCFDCARFPSVASFPGRLRSESSLRDEFVLRDAPGHFRMSQDASNRPQ